MRLTIAAIGKAGRSLEGQLCAHYLDRLPHKGKIIEYESSVPPGARRIRDEGEKLLAAMPSGCKLVVLDGRGDHLSSDALAELIRGWRDAGIRDAVFAIGGADGHGDAIMGAADRILAFGAQTWPHLLVRAMLAEQLYRAEMIIRGHPYHRGHS